MMAIKMRRAAAGVAALAVALVTMAGFRGYGLADGGTAPPAAAASCEAPPTSSALRQQKVLAQIRYDSGLVLRYCGLHEMFAQLGAQEQPGLVRAVFVLAGDGEWIDARRARYVRRNGGLALASAFSGPEIFNYVQLLRACARGGCVA